MAMLHCDLTLLDKVIYQDKLSQGKPKGSLENELIHNKLFDTTAMIFVGEIPLTTD